MTVTSTVLLDNDLLPIIFVYNDKRYKLSYTKKGGLILTIVN